MDTDVPRKRVSVSYMPEYPSRGIGYAANGNHDNCKTHDREKYGCSNFQLSRTRGMQVQDGRT